MEEFSERPEVSSGQLKRRGEDGGQNGCGDKDRHADEDGKRMQNNGIDCPSHPNYPVVVG